MLKPIAFWEYIPSVFPLKFFYVAGIGLLIFCRGILHLCGGLRISGLIKEKDVTTWWQGHLRSFMWVAL